MRKRIKTRSRIFSSVIVICVLVIFSTVGLFFYRSKSKTEMASMEENLSLRLNWLPDASISPALVAIDKGYFKEEGLNVTINNGGPDINTVSLLASGSDDIAIASDDLQVLLAINQGVPIKMVGVMWKNPNAYVAKTSSGINTPGDFEGKTVSNNEYNLQAVRSIEEIVLRNGGDFSKVKLEPLDFSYSTFIEGKVDIAQVYISDQLGTLEDKGIEMKVFDAASYNINHYGGPIIVREDMYKEKKGVIKKFLKALTKGLEFTKSNPQESAKIVMKYNDQYTYESLLTSYKNIDKYGVFEDSFHIKPEIIEESYKWLIDKKDFPKDFDWKTTFDDSLLP